MRVELTEKFYGPDLKLYYPGVRDMPEGIDLPPGARIVEKDTPISVETEEPDEPIAYSQITRMSVAEGNKLKARIAELEAQVKAKK